MQSMIQNELNASGSADVLSIERCCFSVATMQIRFGGAVVGGCCPIEAELNVPGLVRINAAGVGLALSFCLGGESQRLAL